MKSYRVFSEAKSYSVLPVDTNIEAKIYSNNEEVVIRVKNQNAIDLLGRAFSKRLSIISEVKAEDIFSAIGKCKVYADVILDKIAMEVGMPVEELKVLKAYEIVEYGENVEMVKIDYNALDRIGSKALNLVLFDKIINSNSNDRINRAMHWYRKALNETDFLDIFSYLWICLETLNPLFRDKYPDAYEISKCESCNFEKKMINTAPLKMFFQNELGNVKLYSNARRIRQSIVHGFEDINVIQKNVLGIIEDLEVACRKAIFFGMGLDNTLFNYGNGICNNEEFAFVSIMKFSKFITDEDNPNYFEPEINVQIEMSEYGNELVIKPIIRTNILEHGCGIAGLGWDIFGNPGYPIRKIQLEIRG